MTLTQAFFGLATLIISTAGGYLAARRTSSGSTKTSNAADLWKETGDIRRELSERVQYWQEKWQVTQTKLEEANERIVALERGAKP